MNSDYETYDFGTPLAFLRRRWPVIIGTAVVVAVVAFFVANVRSDKYSATATVLFRDPGLDQRIFDAPILFGGQGLLGGQNIPPTGRRASASWASTTWPRRRPAICRPISI